MRAMMVVGLGLGDEGKGSVVDALVREHRARWVCRFNGGPQAQHNVVTSEGAHHTFSQWGSGTLAGAGTYLGPKVLVDLPAMMLEGEALARLTPMPRSSHLVDERCPVILPWHVAANRLREMAREVAGEGRHGSCGRGVGECRVDAMAGREVTAGDLMRGDLAALLRVSCEAKFEEVRDLDVVGPMASLEWRKLTPQQGDFDGLARSLRRMMEAVTLSYGAPWEDDDTVIFEGAQGVLLDQDYGFHPHTTWSDTTLSWAEELAVDSEDVTRIGVTRAYATRHGAGPLPTENLWSRWPEPHNGTSEWAGRFRQGHLDTLTLTYASRVQEIDEVALTCLDHLAHVGRVPVCMSYRVHRDRVDVLEGTDVGRVTSVARPVYEVVEAGDLPGVVGACCGAPVTMESWGPTAADKRARVA